MATSSKPVAELLKDPAMSHMDTSRMPKNFQTKYDVSRACGPDARDPRMSGSPCRGSHQVAPMKRGSVSGANGWAVWQGCQTCGIRLLYIPAFGAHGKTRAAGPLPKDTSLKLQELGNDAARSAELRDKTISLDAAEKSALRRLETIKAQKAALKKTDLKGYEKQETTPAPTLENPPVAQEEMFQTPGRKARKGDQAAEELEYETRTESSWMIASNASQSPP